MGPPIGRRAIRAHARRTDFLRPFPSDPMTKSTGPVRSSPRRFDIAARVEADGDRAELGRDAGWRSEGK